MVSKLKTDKDYRMDGNIANSRDEDTLQNFSIGKRLGRKKTM